MLEGKIGKRKVNPDVVALKWDSNHVSECFEIAVKLNGGSYRGLGVTEHGTLVIYRLGKCGYVHDGEYVVRLEDGDVSSMTEEAFLKTFKSSVDFDPKICLKGN